MADQEDLMPAKKPRTGAFRRAVGPTSETMDSILPQLLSFPPHPPPAVPLSDKDYDKGIKTVLNLLSQTSAKKLTSGVGGGGDLLEILDPSLNTLPYLYALVAHVNSSQGGKYQPLEPNKALLPGGRLWEPLLNFMERFDPIQIRYGGLELGRLIAALEHSARLAAMPSIAIQPIKSAILRLDPSGSCFTSTHVTFVRLCLEARAFEEATPVLDHDIYAFPTNDDNLAYNDLHPFPCSRHESSSTFITYSSGLTDKLVYQDHLQYFLLGGMIYTALKKWDRALHFYEVAIISPIISKVSMIQVEAYKKWVLVGLLATGGPIPMPKTTHSQAAKIYHALAKPYDALAEIFQEGIINETYATKLIAEANAGDQIWVEDMNYGLMKQVVDSFRRFSVLKLGKTFAALRIADVVQNTPSMPKNFLETADYIKELIASGDLKGSITETGNDPSAWVLRFDDEGDEEFSEAEALAEIVDAKEKIDNLRARIREADQKLGLSKEYLEFSKKNANQKGNGGDQGTDDFMSLDEDMMVDT